MITLTYEYKLAPTLEQIQTFDQWLEICICSSVEFCIKRTQGLG